MMGGFQVDGQELKAVGQIKYLSSIISEEGSRMDIMARIV